MLKSWRWGTFLWNFSLFRCFFHFNLCAKLLETLLLRAEKFVFLSDFFLQVEDLIFLFANQLLETINFLLAFRKHANHVASFFFLRFKFVLYVKKFIFMLFKIAFSFFLSVSGIF